MKIIQITDLHVGQPEENSFGVDVRTNFLKILESVKAANPDQVVITGDLCLHRGTRATYEWIKPYLEELACPYQVISGNHDDSSLLAAVFGIEDRLSNTELFYAEKISGCDCLYLDTAKAEISNHQMDWLSDQLQKVTQDVLVFMHHPPLVVRSAFMEKFHSMRNREKLQAIFRRCPHSVRVFCGHYHVEKTAMQDNIEMYLTPSTYVQIDTEAAHFAPDHYRIAYREILLNQPNFETSVHYITGHKL